MLGPFYALANCLFGRRVFRDLGSVSHPVDRHLPRQWGFGDGHGLLLGVEVLGFFEPHINVYCTKKRACRNTIYDII
jgi:hypothetical protein